jgi:hypothetical protein
MTTKDKNKHVKAILELIPTQPIFTFTDIFVYYKKICRATAYKVGIDKIDDIKEAIYDNKRKGVSSLLARWVNGDNPTLQIAAMRIISDSEERRSLNQQYVDHSSEKGITMNFVDGSNTKDGDNISENA